MTNPPEGRAHAVFKPLSRFRHGIARLAHQRRLRKFCVGVSAYLAPRSLPRAASVMTRGDTVNPRHYADLGRYSSLHVTEAWEAGYHIGQVLKYLQRAPHKGTELDDLRKARWYLQRHLWLRFPDAEPSPIGHAPWDTSGREPDPAERAV